MVFSRRSPTVSTVLCILCFMVWACEDAAAQTLTWNGNGDGSADSESVWTVIDNWDPTGTLVPASGDTVIFNEAGGTPSPFVIRLNTFSTDPDQMTHLLNLQFNGSTTGFTIGDLNVEDPDGVNQGALEKLTFSKDGSISISDATTQTIAAKVAFYEGMDVSNTSITAATGSMLNLNGIVSGSGTLTFGGAGTINLTNANTYTGATIVTGDATLVAQDGSAIADSSNVTVGSDATLNVTSTGGAVNEEIGSLAGGGSVTIGSNTLTTDDDGPGTEFSGVISGVGGSLVKQGTYVLTLSGMNSYNGGTTINEGTLQIGDVATNGGASGSISGDVSVASSSNLAFARTDSLTFGGQITGTGAVQQVGTGTTILTAANGYSGGTTISAGTLRLDDNLAAGTGTISHDAGTLLLSSGRNIGNLLTYTNTATSAHPCLAWAGIRQRTLEIYRS